jgi:hypothetical protein
MAVRVEAAAIRALLQPAVLAQAWLVLLVKVTMVAQVLIHRAAQEAVEVVPVQSDLVYQPDRIHQMPDIQVVPTAELGYLHQ